MKKYDSYKDSGVEWIGEIPSHWEIKKIKHLFEHTKGRNGQKLTKEFIGENEGEYPVYSGSTKGNGELGRVNEYEFDTGDESVIFVSTVGSDTTVMSTRILSGKFNLSQNCLVMSKRKELDIRFVYFFTLTDFPYQRSLLPVILKEGHRSVGMGELDEFKVVFPPFSEQQQIATFLDIKTLFIDSLIKKTQQKIELLKEKRTSLINEAVTKGLNPNVEMKDSGVEWIGEIPSHWFCVGTNKVYHDLGTGTTPTSDNTEYYDESGHHWITTTDLNEGIMYDTLTKITEKSLEDYPNQRLYPSGSIFISMYGGRIGKLGVSTFESYCNQSVCVLPKNDKINVKFYYYWFLGFQELVKNMGRGGGQPNINKDMIKQFPTVKLSLSEQTEIVSYLDEHTQLIDKTISVEERRIELLKEYRQSLISEVVTGKIDVCQDNGIPWFQKPVPKVTIHKFETPINGREAIIGTIPPIWGKDVYDIVLDNLEIVNSLFTSDLQFELISKYLIPVGTDPDDCYLLLKDNLISGILYFKVYYPSRNEDYGYEPKGTLFEIVNSEIEISIIEKARHWVFDDLMEKGFSSFLLYYRKSYGKSSDDVLTFKEIKEKLSNG